MNKGSDRENRVNDCWNHNGIWGKEKPRCPELEKMIHCRNCKVYSEAGHHLLERMPPEGYLQELQDVIAKEYKVEDYKTESIVVFRLGNEWLALPTIFFKEVICMRKVHTLPHRRYGSLRGLINVHGELLICISLGRLLGIDKQKGIENKARKIYKRFIVFAGGDESRYVFPVSEIRGIFHYAPSEIYNAPSTATCCASSYLNGMLDLHDITDGGVVHIGCLDGQKLLDSLEKEIY